MAKRRSSRLPDRLLVKRANRYGAPCPVCSRATRPGDAVAGALPPPWPPFVHARCLPAAYASLDQPMPTLRHGTQGDRLRDEARRILEADLAAAAASRAAP